MLQYSLLTDGLFNVKLPISGEAVCLSLPQVLARLSEGQDLTFTSLRPHQAPAWHAFLVQLGFLALDEHDAPVIEAAAEEWVARLLALTAGQGDEAAWCLLNTNWQLPAFLQPPCSAARVADYKHSAESAQDIDVLVTARHHDEKTGKLPLAATSLDSLVYALVTMQGWSSFMGRGNYNTMRMNGGFSSRPQFRLIYEPRGSGPEFLRDLQALLDAVDGLVSEGGKLHIGTGRDVPHKLLWLLPWETGSLPVDAVHPLCLEVCRRVRLVIEGDGGQLLLRRASSDGMRVDAKHLAGCVMDPWVPILIEGTPKALTAQAHTLSYRSLQMLLFDRTKVALPRLARPSERERRGNRNATLCAQVLVSGDGRTDGFLRREIKMSAPVLARLVSAEAAVAMRAQLFVDMAGQASGKAYRSALLQFVDGSDDVDWKNRDFTRAVEPWTDRFEQAIDEAFFSTLFGTVEADFDDLRAQQIWAKWLDYTARAHLAAAVQSLPTRERSRLFAQDRAERFLNSSLNKHFGALRTSAVAVPVDVVALPSAQELVHD